ncbi:MAG: hypothetical protein J7M09_05515 [Deltaproteobacteria bacterium]|nr:hypothetical protein [Candidatus Tharpella sp.]
MAEKNKVRRFLWPSIIVGLLAALPLLLPLLSLSGLKDRLVNEFSTTLQQPCQIREVRLELFPHPAFSVQGLTCSTPDLNLKIRSLKLEFSFYSLLSLSPQINGIRLRGVLTEIPYTVLVPENDADDGLFSLLPGRLADLFKKRELGSTFVSLDDAICKMTGIPGFDKPLIFTKLTGKWRSQPQSQSENLELAGVVNGGQGRLRVTWYETGDSSTSDKVSPVLETADRLELSCRLHGVSLSETDKFHWGSLEKCWQVDFEKGDLELDVNGDPEAGLRFSGRFSVVDHHLFRSDKEQNQDSGQIYSQGKLHAGFSGFFQRRESYLNIKNATFEYPEAATLFTRGLVRFRKPLFVDLVNHLKVDDLAKTLTHCPSLQLSDYRCLGQLEGDLKLIGNPLRSPVLQVKLNSEKIVFQPLDYPSTGSPLPPASVDSRLVATDFQGTVKDFLRSLAGWEWIVKSDCRVGSIDFPHLHLTEFSFLAEKKLVQLEIERLAAHFGQQGEIRLSLILDDLLHEPRWQASLVAEKFDLKPFQKTLSLAGVLDVSLVGGGRLVSDFEEVEDLVFNGKWKLRQGRFVSSPLLTSFSLFLKRERAMSVAEDFSIFSGKFALRDKILRLNELKINSSGGRLNGQGRFSLITKRLDFSGRFDLKGYPILPFHLSGELDNPLFKTSY